MRAAAAIFFQTSGFQNQACHLPYPFQELLTPAAINAIIKNL